MDRLKELCKARLLAAGFLEAEKLSGNFYRPDEEYTAFFVNFKNRSNRLGICYGLASTAFTRMAACENSLREYGILNEEACIRHFLYLKEPRDVETAEQIVREHLASHKGLSKDELLTHIREDRKRFLNSIHSVLKPAGFKRKGNEWTRVFSEDYILRYWADKSSFCDSYSFFVTIASKRKKFQNHHWCNRYEYQPSREEAFNPNSAFRFDWQLNTQEDLMEILNTFLREYVEPLEMGGMEELGRRNYIRERCTCGRDCCEHCWVDI